MKFTTLAAALSAIFNLTLAAQYPQPITTTGKSSVWLRVNAFDSTGNLNGRNLQLRTQSDGKQIVVIDASSPVLWTNFKKGVLYSQAKDISNQPYSLGPLGYLKNVSTTATTALQEFYFQNATKADPATGGFQLIAPSQDAVYDFYHQVGDGIANGWVACKKNGYYQLFYYQYTSPNGYQPPGCTFIGVETTLAPYLANS